MAPDALGNVPDGRVGCVRAWGLRGDIATIYRPKSGARAQSARLACRPSTLQSREIDSPCDHRAFESTFPALADPQVSHPGNRSIARSRVLSRAVEA